MRYQARSDQRILYFQITFKFSKQRILTISHLTKSLPHYKKQAVVQQHHPCFHKYEFKGKLLPNSIYSAMYYGTLIALFQPLVDIEVDTTGTAVEQPGVTPTQLLEQAKTRLETLIRLYYLRHSFELYDPRLMHWLVLLGNMAIGNINTIQEQDATAQTTIKSLRSTVILCVKGLHSQGQNYHMALLLRRALINRMRPEDQSLLKTYLSVPKAEDGKALMTEYVQVQYVVPIIKINEDPKTANLQNLVEAYENMSLSSSSESSES